MIFPGSPALAGASRKQPVSWPSPGHVRRLDLFDDPESSTMTDGGDAALDLGEMAAGQPMTGQFEGGRGAALGTGGDDRAEVGPLVRLFAQAGPHQLTLVFG